MKRKMTSTLLVVALSACGRRGATAGTETEPDAMPTPRGWRASQQADAEVGVPEAAAGPATVTLAALNRFADGKPTNDYEGKEVCTCGFVQSFGSSPGRSVDGTRLNIIHNVYVAEAARGDEVPRVAICLITGAAAPALKERQEVCVQGEYAGPTIKACSVVAKCP